MVVRGELYSGTSCRTSKTTTLKVEEVTVEELVAEGNWGRGVSWEVGQSLQREGGSLPSWSAIRQWSLQMVMIRMRLMMVTSEAEA